MNQTAAVVVTYNRKELLRQCITKLLRQKGISCDVIIIDNASTDGTEEMIHTEFNQTTVIYENTGKNLGGAGGFEYGIEKAVRMGYEYVWIMDDDTLPEESALAALFAVGKKLQGHWGFLSSVAYWTDDYEFTGRISRKYPCYMTSKSKVVHAMKRHTRVDFATDDASRIERYHYIYRNDVHCYRQYGIAGWAYILLKDIYTVLHILKDAKEERWKRIRIVWKGFWEGLQFSPEIKRC